MTTGGEGTGRRGTALVVLGAHRSGSSALTGLLAQLGAHVGENLIGPAPANVKGHFENKALVELHDRVLSHLGRRWHDERPLPARWWDSAAVAPFRDELRTLLAEQVARSPLWCIKDPRSMRLLPLAKPVLQELAERVVYLWVVRHPAEVASSLEKRDGIGRWRAHLLWLRQILEAERATREEPRALVTYDALLGDFHAALSGVDRALGLGLALNDAQALAAARAFMDQSLRHHAARRQAEPGPVGACAAALYDRLVEAAPALPASDVIEPFWPQMLDLEAAAAPWLAELHQGWPRLEELEQLPASLSHQRERELELELALRRIEASRSWQITRPLRELRRWLESRAGATPARVSEPRRNRRAR